MIESFYITKDVFRSELDCYIKDFTDNHLLVYLYMQKYKNIQNEINFTFGWMFDELDINYKPTRSAIIDALFDLHRWNLIKLYNTDRTKVNKNTRIIAYIPTYNSNFTKLDMYSIDKILQLNIDIRIKKSMLQIYCYLASRIDDKSYCYPSYETISDDLDITENTINDSLVLLKEHKLIAYGNSGHVVAGNKVVKSNNIYTLCCIEDYADILDEAIENRKSQILAENKKVIPANTTLEDNSLAIDKKDSDNKDIDKVQDNIPIQNDTEGNNSSCNSTEGNNFSHNSKVQNNNNNDEFLEKLNKFKQQNNKIETVVAPKMKYNF